MRSCKYLKTSQFVKCSSKSSSSLLVVVSLPQCIISGLNLLVRYRLNSVLFVTFAPAEAYYIPLLRYFIPPVELKILSCSSDILLVMMIALCQVLYLTFSPSCADNQQWHKIKPVSGE